MRHTCSFFLTLLSSMLIVNCKSKDKTPKEEKVPYRAITLKKEDIYTYVSFPTTLQGTGYAEIQAKIAGYLNEINVKEGDTVKKDQTLFILDHKDLKAAMQSAKRNSENSKWQWDKAKTNLERVESLVNQNIIGKEQLKIAQYDLRSSQSMYMADLKSFEEKKALFEYAYIKSPINGVIGYIPYKTGSYINENSIISSISNNKWIQSTIYLNEKQYNTFLPVFNNIQEESELIYQNYDLEKYNHKGLLFSKSGEYDLITGLTAVKINFPNPENRLKTGNKGQVLLKRKYSDVFLIPKKATIDQQNITSAYILKKGKVKAQKLNIIDFTPKEYIVETSLKKGDTLIIDNVSSLKINDIIETIIQ